MEQYKNLNFTAEQINQKLDSIGEGVINTVEQTPLKHILFSNTSSSLKTVINPNQQISVVEINSKITPVGDKLPTWDVYINHLLCINSVSCENKVCSHNYVELANGSDVDINLNGLYLLYTDCSKSSEENLGYDWKYLALTGVIKAGSTFVIRGKQTNPIKGSIIKVESYDMEWDISFKQRKGSFYLCVGDSFKEQLNSNSLVNPWVAKLSGYIDSCGFGVDTSAEGNSPVLVNDNWDNIIFVRWFMFETAKQGNKAFSKRKTKDLWTYIDITKNTTKAGSKLNTINNNGSYRFSRLFKKCGIRLVMAGHKHTYGISKPIYDAPTEYLEGNQASSTVDILSGDISTELSRKPVIQVLQQDQVKESNFARYEVVSKVSAPTYVTCQATGYKLISNKEQPSGDAYRIPWLLAYFPAATSASSPKENIAQHKPMYIRYDVTDNTIKVTAIQINGIWEVTSDSTKYDFNNQIENLTTDKMTLNTSKEEDLTIYSPDNRDFYTLNL